MNFPSHEAEYWKCWCPENFEVEIYRVCTLAMRNYIVCEGDSQM